MAAEALYEVLTFSRENLCAALANKHVAAEILLKEPKTTYVGDYLKAVGAESIVVEHQYIDGDYLDDYSQYYAKCFQDYSRKCKRLHFFSAALSRQEFDDAVKGSLDHAQCNRIRDAYLGFVVARPLPNAVIGRTALKTYPPDSGRRHYTATRRYQVSLFGLDLQVNSLAFQEQDNVLAACATVALWCSFHKTADLFGTPIPTPAQITNSANEFVRNSRPLPSHGLNIQQICNAIRAIGLDPEVVSVNASLPLVSLIYGHLRLGLPVILVADIEGVGHHAIALNGYSINPASVMSCEVDPKSQSIPMTGLRINEFYGHDDQIGPFSRVVIKPSATIGKKVYPVVFEGSWKDGTTGKLLAIYPEMVIIPVYHKVRVTFVDVQAWLNRLHALLSLFLKGATNVVWDVRLTTVNEFKKALRDSRPTDTVRQKLLFTGLPKYMWQATLSAGGVELLECLVDATDIMQSAPFVVLHWHNSDLKVAARDALSEPSLHDALWKVLTPRFAELLKSKVN